MKNREIRLIYLYEFKLGHKATEACTNINSAFGKGTVNVRTVQRWFDKFRSGNTSLKENDGRGRPTSVDNNQLRALVEANPKTTVRELLIELGVSHVTVLSHLNPCATMMPKKWQNQKALHFKTKGILKIDLYTNIRKK